jgi:hypothetical protein
MPNENAFWPKIFSCKTSAPNPGCGTTREGAPMTCFGGSQLGAGSDFCVEQCTGQPGSDFLCAGDAKLRTCRPSEKTADDPDGCGPDLACYRTDLYHDEGVCLAIRVCTADTDCKGNVLSSCAGPLLTAVYPEAGFQTSNLQCVVGGCKAKGTSCPEGQVCLPLLAPSTTAVPDICVPSCDSHLNCPPNYACWKRVSGPSSPAVCLPGLVGARCETSTDCMVGECVDTGAGFSECTVPCSRDEDCIPHSSANRRAFCSLMKGQQRYCVGISPFAGSVCLVDDNCPAGQKCFFTSPYHAQKTAIGECRLPCEADDRCAVRGGLAHACFVRGADRSCYPGLMGLTCQRTTDCMPGLVCQALPPAERFGGAGGEGTVSKCTRTCQSDSDCWDIWKNREGYCEGGWCQPTENDTGPCLREEQCSHTHCSRADGGVTGMCAPG